MLPPSRPQITAEAVADILAAHRVSLERWPLIIIGIRGYYLRTMGDPAANDRGCYDDAWVVVWKDGYRTFNANTDPSRFRAGSGTGKGKGMATLKPGFWPVWKLGLHRGKYLALVQRKGPVTVLRDGAKPGEFYEDNGYFGINGHRGGEWSTTSEGCQTSPEPQWSECIELVEGKARALWGDKWDDETIPYLLIENRA